MKKILLQSFIGICGITFLTGCDKEVKTPSAKPATAKATSSPVTPASSSEESRNDGRCGDNSGSTNPTGY